MNYFCEIYPSAILSTELTMEQMVCNLYTFELGSPVGVGGKNEGICQMETKTEGWRFMIEKEMDKDTLLKFCPYFPHFHFPNSQDNCL